MENSIKNCARLICVLASSLWLSGAAGAAVDHFDWDTVASPQSKDLAFYVTITAKDAGGAVVTTFVDTVTLTGHHVAGGIVAMLPADSGHFVDGVWTGQVVVTEESASMYITADDGSGHTGNSNNFWVKTPGALDHFAWDTISSPQGLSAPFEVRITARDSDNAVTSLFSGTVAISGWRNRRRNPVSLSPSESGNFVNGEWVGNVTVFDSQNKTIELLADDGSGHTGWSNQFDIGNPGQPGVDHFEFDTISSPQTVNVPFMITIKAYRSTGVIETNFTDLVDISGTGVTITPATSGYFVEGVWTGQVTATGQATGASLHCAYGATTGDSNTFDVMVSEQAESYLEWAYVGTPQAVNQAFPVTIIMRASDGSVATGFTGTVALSGHTALGSVSIAPLSSGNFVNGQWDGYITILEEATNMWLHCDDGNGHTGDSNTFFSVAYGGAVAYFTWDAISSPQTINAPFQVTITARDSNGVRASDFTDTVTLSGQTTSGGVTIAPTTSGNFVNGVWTGNITVTQLATSMWLRAVDGSGNAGNSETFNVEAPNAIDHFVLDTIASPQTVNNPFSITIYAHDSSGRVALTFSGTAGLSITGAAGVTIAPSTTGSFVSGVWTGNVTVEQAATNIQIQVDDGSGHTGLSNIFNTVAPATIDHFTWDFITTPQTINAAFAVKITARDASGGVSTDFNNTVTISGWEGSTPVTVSPTTSGYFVNGVWTGNIAVQAAATAMLLRADDGSSHIGESNTFDVTTPQSISYFTWDAISSPQTANAAFAVKITARDSGGGVATDFVGTVTLSGQDDAGAMSISPTTSGNFVNGVWSGNVTVQQTATNAYLHATDGSHTGNSNTFNVFTAGAVDNFTWASITSPQTINSAFQVTITARDAFGGTATGFTGTVSLSGLEGGSPVSISPTTSGAFSAGVWTGNVTVLQTATNMFLRADDGSSHTGDSGTFVVETPGPVDHFVWSTIGAGHTAGTPFSVTIYAKDTQGRTATSFNGTVSITKPGYIAPVTIASGSQSTYPVWAACDDMRTQIIYLPAEVGPAGKISSLSLDVTTIPGQAMETWTIRMKHSALAAYGATPAWEDTGWTTVYQQANQTVSSTGWNTFRFSTPFAYDGVSNLMIDFCYNNSSSTSDPEARYSIMGQNRTIYYRTDSAYGDPLTWSGTTSPTPTVSPTALNIKLSGNVLSPTTSGAFASGVWTGNLTIEEPGLNMYLDANDGGGHTGASNTFTLNP